AGKQVRCPKCQQLFVVGALASEPVAAAAPVRSTPRPAAPPPRPTPRPSPPPTPIPIAANPTECPACKAPLLPGAIACMDCGYLLQPDGAGDAEGSPNLCSNPACGVANPSGE